MQRIAIIARLKPDTEKRATELIESGPPFDPDKLGFDRHSVYLSGNQVVFVFEGGRLDHLLHTVVRDPSNVSAFGKWEPLIDGFPTVAREAYSWQRQERRRRLGRVARPCRDVKTVTAFSSQEAGSPRWRRWSPSAPLRRTESTSSSSHPIETSSTARWPSPSRLEPAKPCASTSARSRRAAAHSTAWAPSPPSPPASTGRPRATGIRFTTTP